LESLLEEILMVVLYLYIAKVVLGSL